MTVTIRTTVVGAEALLASLKRSRPDQNPQVTARGLRRVALLTQQIAATQKIKRGGSAAPEAKRLTSRTGTGRRSISTDFGPLPRAALVGSDLKYMAVHETGGDFTIPTHTVMEHTRTVLFGRTVSPFKVPAFKRKGHTATFPRRAWLEPAVDDVVKRAPAIFAEEWERAL